MKLAWVAGVALSLGGCAHVAHFQAKRITLATPRVEVPLTVINNMLFVDARIDGGPVVTGILDTGAEMLVLSPARVAASHLVARTHSMIVVGVDGKKERMLPFARVAHVQLGGLTLSSVEAPVLDEIEEFGEAMGVPLDALVGGPLLRTKLVTIDYAAQRLVVERGELPEPNGVDLLATDPDSVVPRVSIIVAGKPMSAAIDTGCSSWLDLPAELEASLPLKQAGIPGAKHISANGEGRDRYARLNGELRIGGYVLVDPPVHFGAGAARVCAQLLRHFAITLDAMHARARLQRQGTQPILVEGERTVGFGMLRKQGSWVVADLMPGIAPPGVELGDVLVMVDDRPADSLTRTDLHLLLMNEVLHFTIARAGRRIVADVPVREIGSF
jgi:predicted aspartyl protease